MKCPYCEAEMTEGRLQGDGRTTLRFIADGDKIGFAGYINGKGRVDAKYTFGTLTINAHYCDTCKKIIINTDVQK